MYLKKKLFVYKMDIAKTLENNLDEFKKITIELSNIGDKISDENQAMILLDLILKSFDAIRIVIEYGREYINLGEVVLALRFKELDMKSTNKTMYGNGSDEALGVRGISAKKFFTNNKSQSRSKPRNKKSLRCFIYHKEWYFKRIFLGRKKRYKGIWNQQT